MDKEVEKYFDEHREEILSVVCNGCEELEGYTYLDGAYGANKGHTDYTCPHEGEEQKCQYIQDFALEHFEKEG